MTITIASFRVAGVVMLAAGDFACALSFLERGAFDTRHQRQLITHCTTGPRALVDCGPRTSPVCAKRLTARLVIYPESSERI
jgi:hypothetical protein